MIPFQTNAGTIGGWTYSNPISKGASAVISATKNVVINGKDFIKTGSATITPTAAQVAKTFGKTAGALALSVAIEQILGTVDWVLDPANNSITYTSSSTNLNALKMVWVSNGLMPTAAPSASASCSIAQTKFYGVPTSEPKSVYQNSSGNWICPTSATGQNMSTYQVANPSYDPDAEDNSQPKSLPLSTVANQVISMAEGGNSTAQQAIKAAADTIVAEAETDSTKARPITNQLEQSAETKPADAVDALKQNAGTAKTTNPDGTTAETEFEIPVACTWMPTICEAASVVINKPAEWAESIKAAYDDAVDYFKSEPEQTDNTLDIGEENQTQPDTTISFQTSCPAKIPLTFNWNGQTLDFSFDFTIWCESISTFVYPIVVALGSLHALYIVAGVRQDG